MRFSPVCRSVKVDSRIMSLSVKPDGLISNENPIVLTFKPFPWVSKKCIFYTQIFPHVECFDNLLLKLSVCDSQ